MTTDDKCAFCSSPAVLRVFARHGHEELACEPDTMLALRTCAEREYAGESLRVEFLDDTGRAR